MKKVFLLPLLLLFSCQTPTEKPPRPNILFIMADDHTSQAWGVYGGILQDYVKTPNIRRLADEGCLLNNSFCTNSICVPSRASILTGQYSHLNKVYTLNGALEPDSLNVAKVMQQQGYQTAMIGKWHLKKQPTGFDFFIVYPDQGRYFNPILKTAENWEDGGKGGKEYPGFATDVVTDFSLEWLKNRDPEKPFFLMTHFKATHEPFEYPDRHKDLYKDQEIPEPASLYDFGPETTGRTFPGQKVENMAARWKEAYEHPDEFWTSYPGLPFETEGLDSLQLRKAIYQKLVKDFMRCGAAIDDNIGRLLAYLDESGLAENTVVIYTADQGYFLGEHGFFDKRLMYEESLRMPFVIRYPREIPAGSNNNDMVLNTDFASLFLDYAGMAQPNFRQGRSFRGNLQGQTPADWRQAMYYRYWAHAPIRPGHFGIRTHRYKLIYFYGQGLGLSGADQEPTEPAWEFYDLEKDPQELHNAYGEAAYQEVIEELKTALRQQREELGDDDGVW